MITFNVVSKNADGTLLVEYVVYKTANIPFPVASDGTALTGEAAFTAIANEIDKIDNDFTPQPIDNTVHEELQLSTVSQEFIATTNTSLISLDLYV